MSLAVSMHYDAQRYADLIAPRLRRSTLFEDFTETQIHEMASVFTPCTIAQGEYLFRQGDLGNFMVIISQGVMELQISDQKGARVFDKMLEPFDIVGEMTCLDPSPRSGSILAKTNSEVLVLDRTSVERLKQNHPRTYSKLLHTIWKRVATRLNMTNDAISQNTAANGEVPFAKRQDHVVRGVKYVGKVELDEHESLQNFSAHELDTIAGVARKVFYPRESIIFREGDLGKSCHIIVSGEVTVFRDIGRERYELGKLREGDLFGQIALIEHRRRGATLQATADSVILELSMMDFDRLIQAATPFALRFQELVTISSIRQLQHANERYMG